MTRSRRRRGPLRPVLLAAGVAAGAAVVAAVVLVANGDPGVTVHDAANSVGPLKASYQASDNWGTGYSGQYTITNAGTTSVTGWTLAFTLPNGTSLTSLWNGSYTDKGGQVTVTNDDWDATLKPGVTVTVGFEAKASGAAGQPANCTINGTSCQAGGSAAAGTPPVAASSAPAGPSAPSPTPSRSVPLSPSGSATPSPANSVKSTASTPASSPSTGSASNGANGSAANGSASAGAAGFAPYVDTSLYPPFSLVSTAQATGVKQFNLAFVVSGGGACTPEWGGVTAIGADAVASQIAALRAMGGDARISFGGQAGSELATTCTNVSQLQAAYQQVVSAYGVNKIDFDIEGAAAANTAANALRDQAIVALQAQDPGLQVSFTLPVLPSGLTSDGDAIVTGAVRAGVKISAVNVMAMDYGDGAAPNPSGQMGTFAIDAATATDAQVASALGISDAAAWSKVAVTPMIGVNDTSDEVFTAANAQQLEAFAASKHLAWLSMWSAGRDTQCPGGAAGFAQATCSSLVQSPDQFMKTLGAY